MHNLFYEILYLRIKLKLH